MRQTSSVSTDVNTFVRDTLCIIEGIAAENRTAASEVNLVNSAYAPLGKLFDSILIFLSRFRNGQRTAGGQLQCITITIAAELQSASRTGDEAVKGMMCGKRCRQRQQESAACWLSR